MSDTVLAGFVLLLAVWAVAPVLWIALWLWNRWITARRRPAAARERGSGR
ncbi:MAG: hypothetical protein ACE5GS_16775 [Kiloniellaceae bacterium]